MHCGAGVSRSAALCIAYLMRRFTWPAKRAREHCKQRRSLVNPNQGFWRSLCAFEEQLGITERFAWPRTPFWMHHPINRCYALRRACFSVIFTAGHSSTAWLLSFFVSSQKASRW